MKAEERPLSQRPLMLSLTKFTIGICANCGADASIHQYGSGFCPKNGVEQNGVDRWDWEETTFVNKEWKDAVDRLPELLKAEQELEKKKEDHFNSLVYISNQGLKISELEETVSRLRQELKNERSPNQDINYDLHEGRGENNELL